MKARKTPPISREGLMAICTNAAADVVAQRKHADAQYNALAAQVGGKSAQEIYKEGMRDDIKAKQARLPVEDRRFEYVWSKDKQLPDE